MHCFSSLFSRGQIHDFFLKSNKTYIYFSGWQPWLKTRWSILILNLYQNMYCMFILSEFKFSWVILDYYDSLRTNVTKLEQKNVKKFYIDMFCPKCLTLCYLILFSSLNRVFLSIYRFKKNQNTSSLNVIYEFSILDHETGYIKPIEMSESRILQHVLRLHKYKLWKFSYRYWTIYLARL